MTEGGEIRLETEGLESTPEQIDPKILSDFAKLGVKQLRQSSTRYTEIKKILKPGIPHEMISAELNSSEWKWNFFRRPVDHAVDVEIRKSPLKGQNLVEQAVRLRTGIDPLVRWDSVTREVGPEAYVNDEDAIAHAGAFINELLTYF